MCQLQWQSSLWKRNVVCYENVTKHVSSLCGKMQSSDILQQMVHTFTVAFRQLKSSREKMFIRKL